MNEDVELLSRYVAERSEAAFTELARRHVDLVYSAALRLVHGDVPAAQDITQQVFTETARQAEKLVRHPLFAGWLYTTTRRMALRANRTEQRRKAREQEAGTMNELLQDSAPPADWNQLAPLIEDVMHELEEKDRHAVLLRFFQNRSLQEVGAALDLSENAARMRVERALEKLRGKLARRGITTTAGALAVVVSANAVHAAPAAFVATLSAGAVALQASAVISATKTILMTTLQKATLAAALAVAIGTGIYAVHQNSRFNARIRTLEGERAPLAAHIQQLEAQRDETSNQLAALTEENTRLKSSGPASEVRKLRGEIGALRQSASANESKTPEPSTGIAKLMSDPAMKDYIRQAQKDKLRSMYADLFKELQLSPEQTEQGLELLCTIANKSLEQMTGIPGPGAKASPDQPAEDVIKQLIDLVGPAGAARFKEYSEELPGRTTVAMLKEQSSSNPLSDEQSANLVRIIKAEPEELTRGILGGPDLAFMGSTTDVDQFLQRVAESNQRITQQAAKFLTATQLAALDSVLAKFVENRKLQGAAFFQKH